MDALPTGLVTFLFTDIQGSTRLWEQHPGEMPAALARHDAILHKAIEARDGYVFKTMGDAFCVAFTRPLDALLAAADAQLALKDEPGPGGSGMPVRMALHAGVADERDRDYFGRPINRLSRLLATVHGGQIILSGAVQDAVWHAVPAPFSLLDLGSHRLQDLESPEAIHQLVHPDLPQDFPPLRSLQQFQHNLPCQLTSFIGRETQIADVLGLLSKALLVTLTGSGGIGKTRLSLQVAAERVAHFPDGVWMVELASLTDPALVTQTVAETLKIQEQPGRHLRDTMLAALRDKELLLLLDNCEHLVDASAQLAEALLRGCPKVRILATSREALRIDGEFTYRVPSLDLPDLDSRLDARIVANFAAVRLFRERAAAGLASFEITADNFTAVAQICHRLDGIPLAIELAAARVRGLSVHEIQRRLDDQFTLLSRGSRTALPRQQTLRALIEWSWNLLSDEERLVLQRVSVFAGGCTLEAAEAVCADDELTTDAGRPAADASDQSSVNSHQSASGNVQNLKSIIQNRDVFGLLLQLVDKSLLLTDDRADGTRFRIMETIRAYGLERLRECGEETEVRRRHFDWVASLTTQAQPHFDGPGMPVWLERLHLEHDNIRAALSYASTADEQLQLAIDVHRFWFIRGHLTEGRKWLEGALRDGPTSDETRRAKALNSVGILALRKGDTLAARQAFEESMLLRHTSGDKSGAAAALNNLGLVAYQEGDLITARARFEDSVAIYRELGDRAHVGMVLANLGSSLIDQGDLEPAAAASEEFLTIALETRDPWCTATAWHNLAEIALRKGDLVQARELGGKALTKVDELGDSTQLLQLLIMFGEIALAEGSPVRAAELFGSSEAFRLKEGLHLSDREDALFRVAESSLRSQLSDEDFKTAWLRGGEHSRQDFTHLALAAE